MKLAPQIVMTYEPDSLRKSREMALTIFRVYINEVDGSLQKYLVKPDDVIDGGCDYISLPNEVSDESSASVS